MKKILLIIAIFLSGCVSIKEKERAKCLDYGFQEGTTEYSNCRMQLEQGRHNRGALLVQGMNK